MLLNEKLANIFRLTDDKKRALERLGLETARDILFYPPTRYSSLSKLTLIRDLADGEVQTVYGEISGLKTKKSFRTKIPMAEGRLMDETGSIKILWFNQAYMAKMIKDGQKICLTGRVVKDKNGDLSITNPEIDKSANLPDDVHQSLFSKGQNQENDFIFPVYRETRGITSKWIYHSILKLIKSNILKEVTEYLPKEILEKYNLPNLEKTLIWLHMPKRESDAEVAKKRLSFEEVFFIQLEKAEEQKNYKARATYEIAIDEKGVQKFIDRFPFTPTKGQTTVIKQILADLEKPTPMSRLLEGDVGSGKTFVAASAVYATVVNRPKDIKSGEVQKFGNLQVAYMSPTEILATQQFENFMEFFKGTGLQMALITGSGCRKFPSKVNPSGWTNISRAQLTKWVANGEIPIVIGTHALISKSINFKHLALAIVDEQHRFGVNQRMALVRRTNAEQTRNDTEKIDPFLYKDLTYRIRTALFNVKKELGGGHKEIVYQRALAIEFEKNKLNFSKEIRIPISYNKKNVGTYIPDFVVEDKIIVELKAQSFVGPSEKKQLWTYLKGGPYRLGLLANFGPKELTVDRVIYDKARGSASVQHSSASVPHFLSMTATPIPRTLALTIYGDLDLSVLDEMPKGRKPIITELVTPDKRDDVYEHIKKEMALGRQLYVICPRIDTPDETEEIKIQMRSVKAESQRLKKDIFPNYNIGILHSKMNKQKKEEVMEDFLENRTQILVATSVVEVGVNVPNATMIIIEGGERFGLSQLHQLRGRVMRSSHQPYCFIFTESNSDKSMERLKAIKNAKNGFELAELDLALRGAGDLAGGKQWGVTDLGMEALKNIKMVEFARFEARELIEKQDLSQFPALLAEKTRRSKKVHFE